MNLTERLDVLKNSGTLSRKNYDNVVRVIRYFKERRGIELTEENASAFITHLCMALERIDKGEEAQPLDRTVYEEARRESTFAEAEICCRDICEILPQISGTEAEYISTHIGVMLANKKEQEEKQK